MCAMLHPHTQAHTCRSHSANHGLGEGGRKRERGEDMRRSRREGKGAEGELDVSRLTMRSLTLRNTMACVTWELSVARTRMHTHSYHETYASKQLLRDMHMHQSSYTSIRYTTYKEQKRCDSTTLYIYLSISLITSHRTSLVYKWHFRCQQWFPC